LSSVNTFETIASRNSSRYVNAAFEQGIVHPVGMCLQDAGWRFGPWLRDGRFTYQPTEYVTWRDYFEKVATRSTQQECRLSQEDIQVSLAWGAQVLQKIARQVRSAENRIVMAEKMAALAGVYRDASWPQRDLDEAWRVLLLAQHHDCWIVPYNGRAGSTWADKVAAWTTRTRQTSEQIIQQSMAALNPTPETNGPTYLRVFNTLGSSRHDLASFSLPDGLRGTAVELLDDQGREVASQISSQTDSGPEKILFLANVPPLGFETYRVEKRVPSSIKGASISTGPDGCCKIESDLYSIVLDPAKGGTIRSLVAKKLGHRELVDRLADRRFGEIRGWFYAENKFKSNAENPATITPLESGPLRVRLKISGRIGSNPVTQILTVVQGQRRIDFSLQIDWQENPRIGADFEQVSGYRAEHDQKAFYDDRFKLLALFPLKLAPQRVFKDAPFDVTESRLTNTFFNCWSGIKNNVMLNWVDAEDTSKHCGVALLTDHTTSYAHGADFPLGLVLQYAGVGLWGRNYDVNGPTEVNYALVPHAGNWEQSGLEEECAKWKEPIMTAGFQTSQTPTKPKRSLLTMDSPGWEIPTLMMDRGSIMVRLFNTSTDAVRRQISYDGHAAKIELVQLDGKVLKELARHETRQGRTTVDFALPGFGIATLKISP
jgi:alpha-mannosidase